MSEHFHHRPVMAGEVVAAFEPIPPGVFVDATVGGGGHARLLLAARPDLRLVGLDRDPAALVAAAEALAPFSDRVELRHASFDRLAATMGELAIDHISGCLFDLGVSSPQLDRPERGSSYRATGPLDMRMDPTSPWSAADVVNGYAEADLADVLRRFGEERYAARIARAIVAARPLETTADLAEVVRDAIPAAARRRGRHPARRAFQAIRIEVNRELEQLPHALDQAVALSAPAGRIAVLTYHSGEDRIVKERFRFHATGGCTCPPGLPCVCDAVRTVRIVRLPSATPSTAEVAANRRAESARLRVVERLPLQTGDGPHEER
jgi:16S rRNA (cytosine1402-N4)-methyltransferase